MFLFRLLPVAVVSVFFLAACMCGRSGAPTAEELHELTLEELLEIPIETVRRLSEESRFLLPSPVPAVSAAASAFPAEAGVGAEGVDEYQLKAAFIAKFVKYVTWPPERLGGGDAPLVVGVLGQDPFGDRLEAAFKSRKAGERLVVVRRFSTPEGLEAAHVLFVPAQEASRLGDVLRSTRDAGLLLIGESTDFAARGGVINFYLEGDKLRFEINTESAKRQRLKVSSDLLKLARIVSDKG
jgi:hypothetical protein